ncbi:MAG: histidine phosphatase family protein [Gordonia amarae]
MVERRYSGRGNPELTELGRSQATAAGTRLGADKSISAIVSSPLARARATAQAVADVNGLDVEVVEGLTETDFGAWEGLTFLEAAARDPLLHREWLGDVTMPPPDGESFAAVADRVGEVKQSLLEQFPEQTVLVVSHVTPIKTLLRDALRAGPEVLYSIHLDLASVSIVEFYADGGSVVKLVNDTSHL